MKFRTKSSKEPEIPTASMPDVVFQLLLFFMVSSTFNQFSGLPVDLPVAKRIEKLEAKKNVTNIWANADGDISIDDKLVVMNEISKIMYQKRVENPKLVVSLKCDRLMSMNVLTDIHTKLRVADALRVNYCAKFGD